MTRNLWFASLCAFVLSSCGTDTNLNQFFVSKEQSESVDVLTSVAEVLYDQGDFNGAREKAEKAYNINPNNEPTAVLLGYIYLSLAGIDAFQLAKSLIDLNQNSSSTSNNTGSQQGGAGGQGGPNQNRNLQQSSTGNDNAADTLNQLSTVIGISRDDVLKLGTVPTTAVSVFEPYPVIHPLAASTARESAGVATLTFINRAVQVICPFVDSEVLIEGDPRHSTTACPASGKTTHEGAKVHFLWAFAHLTDALAFREVLLYKTDGNLDPNVQLRAEAVSQGAQDVNQYLTMVTELNTDISAIFDPANADSQLNAVLNGLKAASAAFGQLPGIPSDVTAGITEALSSVENAAPSGVSTGEADVLKGQLTSDVSGELSTKIDSLAAEDPEEFAARQEEICELFDSISAGQSEDPPENCS